MKKIALAVIAALAVQFPAIAGQPFRYNAKCYILKIEDQCVVIETRESGGGLKSRNIFSNKTALTIKTRWNGQKFVTWDSHNNFEYDWQYKPNPEIVEDGITGTLVMPGVTVINISWD
jgi:hypothetical protein